MGVSKAAIVPIAVLAALCTAMLMFVCWWFPRKWASGQAQDLAEYEDMRRRRELAAEASSTNGDNVDVELAAANVDGESKETARPVVKPVPRAYVPPVTPY